MQDFALNGKPAHFPLVVADNFYDDPDLIRKIALGLEYKQDPQGMFPGKRTAPLFEIDPALDQYCCIRFLSLYFDFDLNPNMQYNIFSHFQIVDPLPPANNPINEGWTHVDFPSFAAAVVYLTPDADLDSGTSIYRLKDGVNGEETDLATQSRMDFYKTGCVPKDYVNLLEAHNSKFEKTVDVKNQYNRAIAYDSKVYHRASTHFVSNGPRLTQVFFLDGMMSNPRTMYDRLRALPSLSKLRELAK